MPRVDKISHINIQIKDIQLFTANKYLEESLNKRRNTGCLRTIKIMHGLVDFCSNDYLGFSTTGALRAKILELEQKQARHIYEGSTGSRLISGNSAIIESLEEYIASFHNSEAALLFNSGYDANIGLFSCVPKRGDTIFYDELVHASIRDGIRLSYAKAYSFKHNDISNLNELIKLAKGSVFVAVESVYSMDGDIAPLKELVSFCEENNANLIVDEAHATGVFGNAGEACISDLMLEKRVFARIHTYGKALGTHGASVVGSNLLKEYLINFARSFIYTTALPYHSIIAIKCAYNLLTESDEMRNSLHENIKLFTHLLSKNGIINKQNSISPIQCILIEGNENVINAALKIQKRGFDVRPIMSPTVPEGKERLRICIHAFNTENEINGLVEAIDSIKLSLLSD